MRFSPKTLLSTLVLVCVIGAGIFLRAPFTRDQPVDQVAASPTERPSDVVQTVQILEQQLTYATAEATQAESQLAAARDRVLDLTARLQAARADGSAPTQELEEQLASATAEVARLERRMEVTRQVVGELAERVGSARAAAGL